MKMQLLLGLWPTLQCGTCTSRMHHIYHYYLWVGSALRAMCSQADALKMTGGNRLDSCCLAIGLGGFVMVMHMHYRTGGDMP